MVSAYESHHGTLDSMEMRNFLCPHKDVTTNPLGFEVYKPEKDTYNSIQKESTLGKCHCPLFLFLFSWKAIHKIVIILVKPVTICSTRETRLTTDGGYDDSSSSSSSSRMFEVYLKVHSDHTGILNLSAYLLSRLTPPRPTCLAAITCRTAQHEFSRARCSC